MDEATRKAFELLGVPPTADKKAVTVAYRDLTVVWHPDRLPKGNERLAKKANEKLKELTRGQQIDSETIRAFVEGLELSEQDKQRLLEMSPASYTGMAEKLVDEL